ncbi:hypothetical protein EXIGLDRAFT_668877 [Exidia glandulosa HHB12029]|uniref:Uncharacterized protein n=1 Tax=Exidia glandulosa HHB12029 TaxID=1314781 RepID=A0A165MEY8_EXIGL|nr:hypothetical protein EXIGLDRAFT_668877 [Exidia glandulosa HHB12029]
MSLPGKSALKKLWNQFNTSIRASPNQLQNLVKAAATPQGHRVTPPEVKKKEEEFGVRIDRGETLPDGKYALVAQENGKGAHTPNIAKAVVDPKKDDAESIMKQFEETWGKVGK